MKAVGLLMERKAAQVIGPGQGQKSSALAAQTSFWQRLVARVRSRFEIPYGYEDENGFHYGHEPVPPHLASQLAVARKVLTDRACDAMLSSSPIAPPTAKVPDSERNLKS